MMDKTYILKNNILEQYLLGELTINQELELKKQLENDSELRIQLELLEANFEALAFENSINPPVQAKVNLLKTIKATKQTTIPIHSAYKTYFKLAASVAAVLLIASTWMFIKLNNDGKELRIVENEREQLIKEIEGLNVNLEDADKWLSLLNSPDTKQYILKGNNLSPDAKVLSYVNHNQKSVVINTENLPELDDKHDYQMWADVEGEMINMGLIDKSQPLLAMNYIEHAESLNITIEPVGGNDHPTVSRLITNVYL